MPENMTWIDILNIVKDSLIVIVPAVWGIIYAIRKNIKEKKTKIDQQAIEKRVEMFNRWEYEMSASIISRIKNCCNYFKDQSAADLVSFFQLENGTIATSKLHNMFITCLAEDDRFGKLPKYIKNLQRLPYSQVNDWVDKVRSGSYKILKGIEEVDSESCKEILKNKGVKSGLYDRVEDGNGYFIGICCLEYEGFNFNDMSANSQEKLLNDFKVTVHSIFIQYHIDRETKMKELGISQEDVSRVGR